MRYDDPAGRKAYVAGASEAIDAMILHLTPPEARELEGWLTELGEWSQGEPPLAPHRWGEG